MSKVVDDIASYSKVRCNIINKVRAIKLMTQMRIIFFTIPPIFSLFLWLGSKIVNFNWEDLVFPLTVNSFIRKYNNIYGFQ